MAWPDRGTPPPIDARSPTAGDARSVETSFRRSLHRATILPIVLLTVGSIFLVALVLGLRGAHRWVDHTDVVIGRANLLQKLTVEREDALRGYLLSHERAFLDAFNDADLRLSPLFDELQELTADDPAQVQALRDARVEVIRSRHHAAQQLDRIYAGESVEAVATHVHDGTAITGKVLAILEGFIATEQQHRPVRLHRADRLTVYALVIGVALGIAVGGAIALGTANQMRFVRRRYLDVLDRQTRTERALEDANDRLRDADRRKDEFLGLLSHELRNPLAPIRNAAQVLGRAEPGSDRSRRARDIIERQVQHLTHLVEDLLDVKRISAGKMQIRPERMDLVARVRELVEDMRPVFVQKAVRLELRVPTDRVWIDADATRISQMVGNLLQNAVKFTDPGGLVSVDVESDGAAAHVRVVDTGVGIAPEALGTLFEPFVQAPQTLDRSRGGLGLGLALVRGIVELHRGTVMVRSELGRGAEFEVSLPLASTAAPTDRRKSPRGAGSPHRRIVIIEDNEDAAASLRDLLEVVGGHEVWVEHDGAEGLATVRRLQPDLVLCDLGLPTIDGYEVARQLRMGSERTSAILVALSGYAAPDDVERSIRAGFDYHLPKPPDLEALFGVIESAGARASDEASS